MPLFQRQLDSKTKMQDLSITMKAKNHEDPTKIASLLPSQNSKPTLKGYFEGKNTLLPYLTRRGCLTRVSTNVYRKRT